MKIAICDDNIDSLNHLKEYISSGFNRYTDDFDIQCFESGKDFLDNNERSQFDILFLDIDMPDISGFDVAKRLRDNFSNCFIIFVTNHADLVYRSLDFQPFNFIRKNPTELFEQNVNDVIGKLMKHMKQNERIILEVETGEKITSYYRNIAYIKSERHYLYYYLQDRIEPIKIRGSINDVEKVLEPYDFVRIHRSYIVNLRAVAQIFPKNGSIRLNYRDGSIRLSMSQSYKEDVDRKYAMYLRTKV